MAKKFGRSRVIESFESRYRQNSARRRACLRQTRLRWMRRSLVDLCSGSIPASSACSASAGKTEMRLPSSRR